MLWATLVVATAAGAASLPAAGAEREASVSRRRGVDQCRIVDPSPRAAGKRGRREDRAALQRSQARAWAELRRSAEWSALSQAQRREYRAQIRRGRYYSAASTLDLDLGVAVGRGVSEEARVQLRLLTPRGHVYQTIAARGSDTPRRLRGSVPVAGTAIVNHSLYGRWTVEPLLDGQSCGDPVSFWIGE